jgi:type IV pilus assembly protein PilQ
MRLKQLLGIFVLLLVCTTMAAAAGSQLNNVAVTSNGTSATVTIHATGAFTHNEYRPEDKVLLVDLAGVSAANLPEMQKKLDLPAVKSYRVLTYKGASGAEVTRVELALGDNVALKVKEIPGAVELHLTAAPGTETAATTTAPATAPKAEPRHDAVTTASSSSVIQNISVQHTKGSMAIEIKGASNAHAMKLENPSRIVLDFAGTVSAMRSRTINVNSPEVKSIRVARFQQQPPVTRVVVDLNSPRDFELKPQGNGMVLTLQPVAQASMPASQSPRVEPLKMNATQQVLSASSTPETTPVPKAETKSALEPKAITAQPQKAQDYAFVEPQYKKVEPGDRADSAATTMAKAAVGQPNLLPDPSELAKPGPARNLAVVQQEEAAQAAKKPGTPKYTGEPISVNLKDVDLKDFFRLIHEISGLNVVLDPGVRGSVTLVLDDVPWDQALDIVLQNNSLDRQLQGNVLRIASTDTIRKEADAKRAQIEAQSLALDKQTVTRFLSYARAKEIAATVKRFLSQRGEVVADERTNALIIQDVPTTIPDVDRLLAQLDRKTQEVEIEARVVAANRTYARDLGMQLGFGWGNNSSAVGGAGAAGQSPLKVGYPTPPPYFQNGGVIPLFSNLAASNVNSGISFANIGAAYRLDAVLTMAESRGLVKILSRPRIVTQNNVAATVRQGLHIPIVTAAQLGGPPTTSYTDAFLRLTVTPQITVENTIFLAVDVENTTPDFGTTVGGNPTLLTQQATTQVLVTDGGTVVIGGVIQTQNSISTDQTPFLGDIPILGNLFKHRSVRTQTQELIFFISPRIIQT